MADGESIGTDQDFFHQQAHDVLALLHVQRLRAIFHEIRSGYGLTSDTLHHPALPSPAARGCLLSELVTTL